MTPCIGATRLPQENPMTRVALYARYSSDNQRDASIEDQFRICKERAARETWNVVASYKDAGISGASMILRPGIQALLQDAQSRAFDILLAEALDRISRDQADVATLFKQLRFAGAPIVTLAEGEITELHVGLKGTMNALFLKDLAAKTHRGLQVRRRTLLRISGHQEAGRARLRLSASTIRTSESTVLVAQNPCFRASSSVAVATAPVRSAGPTASSARPM
jgi:DNA invertase Pin-like site-specific DNA recombinase